MFFSLDKGEPEGLYLTNAESRELKALLDDVSFGRSSLLTAMQTAWKESYTYDANSNRLTKTTPWGTVDYDYDNENRLVYSGVEESGTTFSYDANGNLLSKKNAYKTEQYAYNGLNRMAESVVTDTIENTQTTSYYGYDAFGRRTLVQDEGFATMRTLYDGQSFDIIRENEVFGEVAGGATIVIGEDVADSRGQNTNEQTRFTGTKISLYANGENVGVNRYSSADEDGNVDLSTLVYDWMKFDGENGYASELFGSYFKKVTKN